VEIAAGADPQAGPRGRLGPRAGHRAGPMLAAGSWSSSSAAPSACWTSAAPAYAASNSNQSAATALPNDPVADEDAAPQRHHRHQIRTVPSSLRQTYPLPTETSKRPQCGRHGARRPMCAVTALRPWRRPQPSAPISGAQGCGHAWVAGTMHRVRLNVTSPLRGPLHGTTVEARVVGARGAVCVAPLGRLGASRPLDTATLTSALPTEAPSTALPTPVQPTSSVPSCRWSWKVLPRADDSQRSRHRRTGPSHTQSAPCRESLSA